VVMAAHHRPQAHRAALSPLHHLLLFHRWILRAAHPLELLTPAGDLVQADTYNKLFTMHGMVMVFFFLIPSIPAVLGNFLVPLMTGPRISRSPD